MKAWHFVGDTLRDGSPVPADGVTLTHDGPLVMCRTGLHASKRLIDALTYAPGDTICRVDLEGAGTQGHTDKVVCRSRTILWRINGEAVLREFARKCALDVIHLWDAPDVVRQYLETGDESRRAAASDAASDAWAASAAARSAARAAGDAARAAGDAARAAWVASAAARNAARAAGDAARAAQNKRLTEMVEAARKGTDR